MAKKGLGRGLSALMDDNLTQLPESEQAGDGRLMKLRISDIEPNRKQPRKRFDENALMELADSIGTHGLLEPIAVRKKENGFYEIIAGERRWRAARMAGLGEIPAIVREIGDEEAALLALIENLQREDLNPVEEALGYKDLMERYALTQEEAAKRVGKARASVANLLRILRLPKDVLAMVEEGRLSFGHARTLLPLAEQMDDEISTCVALLHDTVEDTAVTLEQLAEDAHMNKYYLSHAFKREYGISPINYMITKRIEESKYLLAETDLSMSQIAQLLGFSSLSYFSQVFRRTQATTPMEYRQSTKNM